MTALNGLLTIRDLELRVNLGWRDKELMDPQSVMMDCEVFFPEIPAACVTDELNDTLCYAELIDQLRSHLNDKQFRLVEHLSNEIYKFIESHLPPKATIRVTVTKKPKIDGLLGGVSFSCSNKK